MSRRRMLRGTAVGLLVGQLLCGQACKGELVRARERGDPSAVQERLEARPAQASRSPENGKTPLHRAAMDGNTQTVKALLADGDVDARDAYGNTPLHLAAMRGCFEVVEALVAAGADVKATALNRYTPLHLAAWGGDDRIATLLIQKGADVKAQDYDYRIPLHYASTKKVVEVLLGAGAEVDNRWQPWTRTPLLDAAMHGFPEVVKALLDHGADLQATNDIHFTALHWAAWAGHSDVVKLLIVRGADLHCVDDTGFMPLQWAQYWGYRDIVKLLEGSMARKPR